jgi:hypothetical protein
MDNTAEAITWYTITRDIIIPLLGILTTITIGVVIAIILKRREEKTNKKQLLVDNFMDYFTTWTNNNIKDIQSATHEVFKEIFNNYGNYFEPHAHQQLFLEKIWTRMDKYSNEYSQAFIRDMYMPLFAIRFTFLIEKEKYVKEMMTLSNDVVRKYYSPEAKKNRVDSILDQVKRNTAILDIINKGNPADYDQALDLTEKLVEEIIQKQQFEICMPYNAKIVELIYKYIGFNFKSR